MKPKIKGQVTSYVPKIAIPTPKVKKKKKKG